MAELGLLHNSGNSGSDARLFHATADAGADRVVEQGTTVSLAGAATGPWGDNMGRWRWVQVDGANSNTALTSGAVTLAGAATATPSFTAPDAAGALHFRLIVFPRPWHRSRRPARPGRGTPAHYDGSSGFQRQSDPDWVTITVRAPNNAPVFTSATETRSMAENTAANTDVGAAVPAATDADGDTPTYTMEGADAASFAFDAATRQIRTRSGVIYDFEAKSSYSVTIKADDGYGGSATVAVTITLTDVAEPPVAPAAPDVTATAGSTTRLDVAWTAPANTGRPDITGYDLRHCAGSASDCTQDSDFTDGPQDVTGTMSTITGLVSGTLYQVQVRAGNDEGDGDWSDSGAGTTSTVVTGGALRLADGEAAHEGRVELRHDGEWRSVCDDYRTTQEADVVCREVGYAQGSVDDGGRFTTGYFARDADGRFNGNGKFWLDDVMWRGDEARLLDCPRRNGIAIGTHNCRAGEEAGVRCRAGAHSVPVITRVRVNDAPGDADNAIAPEPGADGYTGGETLEVTLEWSEAVVVTTPAGARAPVLAVDVGDELFAVPYTSGSDTERTVFSYTVDSGTHSGGVQVYRHSYLMRGFQLHGSTITSKANPATAAELVHDGYPVNAAEITPPQVRRALVAVLAGEARRSVRRSRARSALSGLGVRSVLESVQPLEAAPTIEVRLEFDRVVVVDTTGGTGRRAWRCCSRAGRSAEPDLAVDRLGLDAAGLGLLHASRSAGGIVGGVVMAMAGPSRRLGMVWLAMIAAFGLEVMALGLAPSLPIAVVVTMTIAFCAVASDVLTQSMMQLAVPGALRGRAMGAWQVAVGFSPIGHLEMGLLAGAVGTAGALLLNGAALVLVAVGAGAASRQLREM